MRYATMIPALLIAAVLPSGMAAAQSFTRPQQAMIARWTALNERCRGGSGDNPATMAACDRRETLTNQMRARGLCYGRPGQAGYQMAWRHCRG